MRFLLGAVAGVAAVACTPKSEVRAKLEDGVVVPAVYACRKPEECRLELKTQPPLEISVPLCDQAELAEDASGKAIAHRCSGKPWNVVRLRGGDRYLVDCNVALGAGVKPDWSKLGAIEPRAMQLLDCASGDPRQWSEIAKAILEDSGPELAAKFVVASTLRTRGSVESGEPDGWIRAFDTLPPAAQELVRKETCSALQRSAATSLLYHRAARRCPLDGLNVGDIALQAFKNHLAASRPEFNGGVPERSGAKVPPTDLTDAELGFAMEGFIAMKQKPKEAAQASCDAIVQLTREYDPIRVIVTSSVISLTKTRCAGLDAKKDLWPCDLVAPQKSKISEHVAQFANPPGGAVPVLVSPNEAVFDAVTIDGKYPPGWNCP